MSRRHEYRDLLAGFLAELAPQLGDCPACYGLGILHRVTGTDGRDGDPVFRVWRDDFCGGSGWLRRGHRPANPLHTRPVGSYVGGEARPSAANGGTSANDSVGARSGLGTSGGVSNHGQHHQIRTPEPGRQDGRGRQTARREGPSPSEGRIAERIARNAGLGPRAQRPGNAHRSAGDIRRIVAREHCIGGDRIA